MYYVYEVTIYVIDRECAYKTFNGLYGFLMLSHRLLVTPRAFYVSLFTFM